MSEVSKPVSILPLVTDIVASHLSKNPMAVSELPRLIREVYQALAAAGGVQTTPTERPVPAVPIKRSVNPDYIVCLEDGKKLKMLKRHIRTSFGLSPENYRERWGLPADYPMVAPNYAAQRSAFAKKIGLGRTTGAKSRRPRAKK